MPNPDYPRGASKSIWAWLDLSADKAQADVDKLETAVETASIALNAEEVRFATVCTMVKVPSPVDGSRTLTLCVFTDEHMVSVYLEDFSEGDETSPETAMVTCIQIATLVVNPLWDKVSVQARLEALSVMFLEGAASEMYSLRFDMPPRRRPDDEVTMAEDDAEAVRRVWSAVDFLRSKLVAR